MKRETPAVTAFARKPPEGGEQKIYSCADHTFATIRKFRELGDEELTVTAADPTRHGCKGCLEDWAP